MFPLENDNKSCEKATLHSLFNLTNKMRTNVFEQIQQNEKLVTFGYKNVIVKRLSLNIVGTEKESYNLEIDFIIWDELK